MFRDSAGLILAIAMTIVGFGSTAAFAIPGDPLSECQSSGQATTTNWFGTLFTMNCPGWCPRPDECCKVATVVNGNTKTESCMCYREGVGFYIYYLPDPSSSTWLCESELVTTTLSGGFVSQTMNCIKKNCPSVYDCIDVVSGIIGGNATFQCDCK